MTVHPPRLSTKPAFRTALASCDASLRAAQKLRYDVFVRECGADGALVDHDAGLEIDAFDDNCDHLVLYDDVQDLAVGVYRLIREHHAAALGRFYSESEYDLSALRQSGRRLLELGRSCLHPDYRGGEAMFHLWSALARYVAEHEIALLFGVASFPGASVSRHAQALSLLHHRYLAPASIRPRAITAQARAMDTVGPDAPQDRLAAMRETPALIKAYLRLGGRVGDGAFLDTQFNTTDVCMVLDTEQLNDRHARIYGADLNL